MQAGGDGPLSLAGAISDAEANCTGTAAISDDGRLVASAGSSGQVRLWDAKTGRQLGELKDAALQAHRGRLLSIGLSPDGQMLLSLFGCPDGSSLAVVWNVSERKAVRTRRLRSAAPAIAEFLRDGTLALDIADPERKLLFWRPCGGKDAEMVTAVVGGGKDEEEGVHLPRARILRISSDGKTLAELTPSEIRLHEIGSSSRPDLRERIKAPGYHFERGPFELSSDGLRVAAQMYEDSKSGRGPNREFSVFNNGDPRVLRVWDVSNGSSCIFSRRLSGLSAIAFSPADPSIFATIIEEKVNLWDLLEGDVVQTVDDDPPEERGREAYAPDADRGRAVTCARLEFSSDGGSLLLAKVREDFIYDMNMDEDAPMDRVAYYTVWHVGDDSCLQAVLDFDLPQLQMLHADIRAATNRRCLPRLDPKNNLHTIHDSKQKSKCNCTKKMGCNVS